MAKKAKECRFYRAKLPMVVWDPRKGRPLCDFSEGHVITSDSYTIKRLLEIGYPEVALDAETPPDIIEPIQPAETPDVRPIPEGLTEEGAAKMQADKSEKEEPPASPAAGASKAKAAESKKSSAAKPKNTPSKEPKKSIRRRDKK